MPICRTADLVRTGDDPVAGIDCYTVAKNWPAFRIPHGWIGLLAIVADAAMIMAASLVSGIGYNEIALGDTGSIETFIVVGSLMSANFCGLSAGWGNYSQRNLTNFRGQVGDVLAAWSLVGFALLTVAFVLKTTEVFSRGATITFFVTGLGSIIAWRAAISHYLIRALQLNMFGGEKVILITEGDPLISARRLMRNGYWPARIFALADVSEKSAHVTSSLRELVTQVIEASRADRTFGIVMQLSWKRRETIDSLVEGLERLPVWVKLLPDADVARYSHHRIALPTGTWAAEIKRGRLSRAEQTAKRALDVAVAGTALLFLWPLMLIVAVLVKIDSAGPALFRQTRTGLNGVSFEILKYRTMSVLENGDVVRQASERDPRVTRVGRLLRKTSIDELPQLINVLKGEMSLVGPRPHAVSHNILFESCVASYAVRYQMKPGITGWAQVNGLRGENRTAETILRRIEFDLFYLKNWSFWLDLQILLRTPWAVIRQKNSY